jgi:Hint domain
MTQHFDMGGNGGFVAGSLVMTLRGAVPVESLQPGDRVITRNGALALRSVATRVEARARLVRISASALGECRPEEDIVVAAGQPILVRDWRAPAMTGKAAAMIPAARLADGEYIRAEARRDTVIYTLHFDHPAAVYAQGLELDCTPVHVPA